MKYHFILNPAAGRGRVAGLRETLVSETKKLFPEAQFHITGAAGDAQRMAAALKEQADVVVAVGGDGTIHEIVNGLMGGRAALGIVPVGSGNDFARMLGLNADYGQALAVLLRDNRKFIDLGKANNEVFANGVGIGFDAEVVVTSLKIKYLRGFLIYLSAVLQTLVKYENINVSFTGSGQFQNKKIFMMTIGNGRSMGGGFYLTPDAVMDDGLFDVCVINALTRREALIHLPKAVKGQHREMPQVSFFRTQKICLESRDGFPAHADGEMLGTRIRRLDVKIIPGALQVIHNSD